MTLGVRAGLLIRIARWGIKGTGMLSCRRSSARLSLTLATSGCEVAVGVPRQFAPPCGHLCIRLITVNLASLELWAEPEFDVLKIYFGIRRRIP